MMIRRMEISEIFRLWKMTIRGLLAIQYQQSWQEYLTTVNIKQYMNSPRRDACDPVACHPHQTNGEPILPNELDTP